MDRRACALLIGVCALLSACSAPTQADLQREVQGRVKVGDDLSGAEGRLKADGFKCGPSYIVNFEGHVYDRSVPGAFISGCAERVEIAFDRTDLKVSGVYVAQPACAGL